MQRVERGGRYREVWPRAKARQTWRRRREERKDQFRSEVSRVRPDEEEERRVLIEDVEKQRLPEARAPCPNG